MEGLACGHWLMHSMRIGKCQAGCRYIYGGSCELAHRRKDVEPEEDTKQAKVAATTADVPEEEGKAGLAALRPRQ